MSPGELAKSISRTSAAVDDGIAPYPTFSFYFIIPVPLNGKQLTRTGTNYAPPLDLVLLLQ